MTKDLEQKAEERMANLVEDHKQRENGVRGHVVVGDAADEIISYAKLEKADMIIIGTHGVKGLEKILIGSTADRVVKKAPCPVLVLIPSFERIGRQLEGYAAESGERKGPTKRKSFSPLACVSLFHFHIPEPSQRLFLTGAKDYQPRLTTSAKSVYSSSTVS